MENDPPPSEPTPGPAVRPGRPMIQMLIVSAGAIFVLLLVIAGIDRLRMWKFESESKSNMLLMGLGIQNFDSAQGALPASVDSRAVNGAPHSWRWSIRPYMSQDSNFRPDYIALIPEYYIPPNGDPTSPLTPYKVFDFDKSIFAPTKDPVPSNGPNRSQWTVAKVSASPRGSANLIFVIEANDPVEWSKPGDIPYDSNVPTRGLKPIRRRAGWMILMGDGSVRFVPATVPETALRAAIDPTSTSTESLP